VTFLNTLADFYKSNSILAWGVGNLTVRGEAWTLAALATLLLRLAMLSARARELNSLGLREQGASSLGVDVPPPPAPGQRGRSLRWRGARAAPLGRWRPAVAAAGMRGRFLPARRAPPAGGPPGAAPPRLDLGGRRVPRARRHRRTDGARSARAPRRHHPRAL